MAIIGIDPGLDGALVVLEPDWCQGKVMPTIGDKKAKTLDLPAIREWLCGSEDEDGNELDIGLVVLEKVHSMPKMGRPSAFKFGQGFGQIEGLLAGLKIPYIEVTPQAWKKRMLAGTNWKGNKKASVVLVKARFPKLSLRATDKCTTDHDGIADAACLALYGMLEQGFGSTREIKTSRN